VQTVGNDLIAAGSSGIARWDGAEWQRMNGLSGFFCAIAEYRGSIYAGGELQVAATGEHTTLARFDGAEWSAVPLSPAAAQWNSPRVSALEVKDGLLYVGGNFNGAQTVASPGVVAWDGQRWYAVGSGRADWVLDLESFRGDLYAAGFDGVQRWDGSQWSSLGLDGTEVEALGVYGDKLVIGGLARVDRFTPGSRGIVSWDGEHWGGFGTGVNGLVYALQQVGGDLYVAGSFSFAGDQPSFSVARWAGSEPPPAPKPSPGPLPGGAGGIKVSAAFVTSDQAWLSYSLPAAGQACLELFDTRGARVATLCDRVAGSGTNVLAWSSGSPAPFPRNGVYFLRLTSQGKTAHAKVIFSR